MPLTVPGRPRSRERWAVRRALDGRPGRGGPGCARGAAGGRRRRGRGHRAVGRGRALLLADPDGNRVVVTGD